MSEYFSFPDIFTPTVSLSEVLKVIFGSSFYSKSFPFGNIIFIDDRNYFKDDIDNEDPTPTHPYSHVMTNQKYDDGTNPSSRPDPVSPSYTRHRTLDTLATPGWVSIPIIPFSQPGTNTRDTHGHYNEQGYTRALSLRSIVTKYVGGVLYLSRLADTPSQDTVS